MSPVRVWEEPPITLKEIICKIIEAKIVIQEAQATEYNFERRNVVLNEASSVGERNRHVNSDERV